MRIKPGDVFAFYIEQKRKYGIVQVLGKNSNAGYDVRIFNCLMDNIEDETIDVLVQTTDFYYILGFSSFDLVTGKRIGRFAVPEFVIVPKYTRKCERKQSGTLVWYVMEDLCAVKTYKKFDETLKPLSPADAWGIQYIKMRWLDGFTLDNWHELEEKWYADYLQKYEPDKYLAVKKLPPFKQWAKNGRITPMQLEEMDSLFKTFIREASTHKDHAHAIKTAVRQLIDGLNAWNFRYNLIETEEREELMEYMDFVLRAYHCTDAEDYVDTHRRW